MFLYNSRLTFGRNFANLQTFGVQNLQNLNIWDYIVNGRGKEKGVVLVSRFLIFMAPILNTP